MLFRSGYPAVDGLSPRELADKLNVSRRLVAHWLRHCWLREIDGKIPLDSLRRFCRAHPDQIPYGSLDPDTQEWLRSMGYSPTAHDEQSSAALDAACDDIVPDALNEGHPVYARP